MRCASNTDALLLVVSLFFFPMHPSLSIIGLESVGAVVGGGVVAVAIGVRVGCLTKVKFASTDFLAERRFVGKRILAPHVRILLVWLALYFKQVVVHVRQSRSMLRGTPGMTP